jgi:hypothetical protein
MPPRWRSIPAVNLDPAMELRDWTRDGIVKGADLAEWVFTRKKERFTPILKGAWAITSSPELSAEEEASMARHWANGWLRAHGMNLNVPRRRSKGDGRTAPEEQSIDGSTSCPVYWKM